MDGDSSRRWPRLDALRGAAIVWMVLYHLAFDLNFYGLIEPRQNFYRDPAWTLQRTCIVSLFLFCAGLGQAAAQDAGQHWPRFWRRWLQVAGCALLVSVGSAWMFPRSWISFGVLHGIALMLLVCRLMAPWRPAPWLLGVLGGLAIALPFVVVHPAFDSRWLNWVGLVTRKPVTEDYVPLLPWLGLMLWGLACGQWLLARQRTLLDGPLAAPLTPLVLLGRWPLSVYMVHQPLFIGGLMAGQQAGWW